MKYLYIAKGSCGELRTQIYIGVAVDYIKNKIGLQLVKSAEEISYMLNGLIKKRKSF